jgi:hypothetical protein
MLIAATLLRNFFRLIIGTHPELESEIFERSDTDPEQITILRASAKHPITSNNKI